MLKDKTEELETIQTFQRKRVIFFSYSHQKLATFQQFVAHWKNVVLNPYTQTQKYHINIGSFNRILTQPDFRINVLISKRYYSKNHSSKLKFDYKTLLPKQQQQQQHPNHPFFQLKSKLLKCKFVDIFIFKIEILHSQNSFCYCDNFISDFSFICPNHKFKMFGCWCCRCSPRRERSNSKWTHLMISYGILNINSIGIK